MQSSNPEPFTLVRKFTVQLWNRLSPIHENIDFQPGNQEPYTFVKKFTCGVKLSGPSTKMWTCNPNTFIVAKKFTPHMKIQTSNLQPFTHVKKVTCLMWNCHTQSWKCKLPIQSYPQLWENSRLSKVWKFIAGCSILNRAPTLEWVPFRKALLVEVGDNHWYE